MDDTDKINFLNSFIYFNIYFQITFYNISQVNTLVTESLIYLAGSQVLYDCKSQYKYNYIINYNVFIG